MIAAAPPDPTLTCAQALLARRGEADPIERYGVDPMDQPRVLDATATALMDLYRRERSSEVYETLVALARPVLVARLRVRLRALGARLDGDEVLQDVLVNIYRYPDRFDGARAGAFRAWSSMIVDNTIRRQLRGRGRSHEVSVRSNDLLSLEADARNREPDARAQTSEACRAAFAALGVVLTCYLAAFEGLSARERHVLEMVEVRGMRYAPLAARLGMRPEALKMVVFRARRRLADRIERLLGVHPDAAI